jgi:hypothetical protein
MIQCRGPPGLVGGVGDGQDVPGGLGYADRPPLFDRGSTP